MTTRSDPFADAKELNRLDDPAVRKRCVKVERKGEIKHALILAGITSLVPAFFLLMEGYVGHVSKRGRYYEAIPALIPYGMAGAILAAAALVAIFFVQNYYLLDPVAHCIYRHFQFLGWRRRRIIFSQDELLGFATTGTFVRTKYSSYWAYQVVALGMDGRKEPISDWIQDGMEACNEKAGAWAQQMGCASYQAPPETEPSVETETGPPVVVFVTPGKRRRRALLVVVIVILGIFPLFMYLMAKRWR